MPTFSARLDAVEANLTSRDWVPYETRMFDVSTDPTHIDSWVQGVKSRGHRAIVALISPPVERSYFRRHNP